MRTARRNKPGVVYHLIWRFVDRDWFFRHPVERAMYLRLLGAALAKSDWRCIGFALMSNHIHLAVIAGRQRLESWAKAVNSSFARWMNERHQRLGPLFADRAKDHAIRPTKTGQLLAYLHNNPVRARRVKLPADSAWTSHRAYLGRDTYEWLDIAAGFSLAGFTTGTQFDQFVRVTPGESGEVRLQQFRRLAAKRGNVMLATPIATEEGHVVPVVARPFATIRIDPRRLVRVVAQVCAVDPRRLCSRQRIGPLVAARAVAVHAGIALGLTSSDVAAVLGVTPQTVSRIARHSVPNAAALKRSLGRF